MSPHTATACELQSIQLIVFLKLSMCRVGIDQQSHIFCAGVSLSIPGTNCLLCVSTAWGCLCGKVRATIHFLCLVFASDTFLLLAIGHCKGRHNHLCGACGGTRHSGFFAGSKLHRKCFESAMWTACSEAHTHTHTHSHTLHTRPCACICEAWANSGLWQLT